MKTLTTTIFAACVALLCAPAAGAQDAATQPASPGSRFDASFTLAPASADALDAAEPLAFDVKFWTADAGNAANVYHRGILLLPEEVSVRSAFEKEMNELDIVIAGPTDLVGEPKVDIGGELGERMVQLFDGALDAIEPAFEREHCDWDTTLSREGFRALLPHLNHMRRFANAYRMRALHRAAKGDREGAMSDVRRMLILAQHVGDGDDRVLVEQLVGIGIYAMGLTTYREVNPEANHYWAFATEQKPFSAVDGFKGEVLGFYGTFDELREPEKAAPDTAGRMMKAWVDFADLYDEDVGGFARVGATVAVTMASQAWYAQRGMSQQEIEATPPYVLSARFLAETYREPVLKAAALGELPPHVHRPQLKRLAEGVEEFPVMSFARILVPTLDRAIETMWRVERQRAMQQTVEAIRHHVAIHGSVPAALDDLELAVPVDCFTGKPFGYERLAEDKLELKAEQYDAQDINTGYIWTVTVSGLN